MPTTVTDQNFDAEVLESGAPVLVDLWAEWCGPCRAIAPILDELADEYGDRLKIAKVNVDENPETARRFAVRSIPTLLVFDGGELKETAIGAKPRAALQSLVDKYVEAA